MGEEIYSRKGKEKRIEGTNTILKKNPYAVMSAFFGL